MTAAETIQFIDVVKWPAVIIATILILHFTKSR